VTGERERPLLRYLDRLKAIAILSTGNRTYKILDIENIETITNSRGSQKGLPERDATDLVACSGLSSVQVRAATAQVQRWK
jgi:hypothetical protein